MYWKSRQEGGSSASGNPGERGGVKKRPHPSGGVWIFSGITHYSFPPFGYSGNESESTNTESVRELPDYLQQLADEEELYCSDKANLPLFEGSTVSVLQALCGYFSWFTEHPGTSKSALSDLLRLHHDEILPRDNYLPSSYDEAISFIKPFLLPCMTYHACRNDCTFSQN